MDHAKHGKGLAMTEKDMAAVMEKAKSGELLSDQDEIEPVDINLDYDDFPEMEEEEEGDRVVFVVSGVVVGMGEDEATIEVSRVSMVHGKSMKLGGGGRFKKLEHALSKRPGVYSPSGLAAAIGRRKYGKMRFQKLAAAGRK